VRRRARPRAPSSRAGAAEGHRSAGQPGTCYNYSPCTRVHLASRYLPRCSARRSARCPAVRRLSGLSDLRNPSDLGICVSDSSAPASQRGGMGASSTAQSSTRSLAATPAGGDRIWTRHQRGTDLSPSVTVPAHFLRNDSTARARGANISIEDVHGLLNPAVHHSLDDGLVAGVGLMPVVVPERARDPRAEDVLPRAAHQPCNLLPGVADAPIGRPAGRGPSDKMLRWKVMRRLPCPGRNYGVVFSIVICARCRRQARLPRSEQREGQATRSSRAWAAPFRSRQTAETRSMTPPFHTGPPQSVQFLLNTDPA
jgi:hypothetical protein